MHWLITPQQTLSVARVASGEVSTLNLGKAAILTFSRVIMERLEALARLEDVQWLNPLNHPYMPAHIVKRGKLEEIEIVALVPPMGASPLSCILEELIFCGEKLFFWCAPPGLSVLPFNLGI